MAQDKPWSRWAPEALSLLEILARVHLAGVLHLDLKPGNVLVTPSRQVVVLDFGVSQGRALPSPGASSAGTPAYMAPEQARGAPCDARSDLYAFGRMLDRMVVDPPVKVRHVIDALCAHDPRDRPATALEAYEALAGRSPLPDLTRGVPWDQSALLQLFAMPNAFAHTSSDAAALLWSRTGGDPDAVCALVGDWVEAGLASWDKGALTMKRHALERLLGLPVDVLRDPGPDLAQRTDLASRTLRHQGRFDTAAALLDVVLPLVKSPEDAAMLQRERVLAAVATERPDALELALYALERSIPTPATEPLSVLVRTARSVLRADEAATRQLPIEAPYTHPELEIWRQGYRLVAAGLRGLDEQAAVLGELQAWAAGDQARETKLSGWWGNHLYRLGRYREAAQAHERAAQGKSTESEQLGSTLNAAAAWLEALELQRARSQAIEARALARRLRHSAFEARATWLERTAAYRLGHAYPPDEALLAAADALGPFYGALFATTDAAAALRLGDHATSARLAHTATQRFVSAGRSAEGLLMSSLAAWLEGAPPHRLRRLVDDATACPVPDLELQVLAFARWGSPRPPPAWRQRILALGQLRPRGTWSTRLDVLSVEEALAETPPFEGPAPKR